MFTGIISNTGVLSKAVAEGSNLHLYFTSELAEQAYIDQSIAHNGVCLTVVEIDDAKQWYRVTAIHETLIKSNLNDLVVGDKINLECCMVPNQRLDGHFVQGHVDTTTSCLSIEALEGSWYYEFALPDAYKTLIVPKGSIAINGTSLTVILDDENANSFKVAIIPYTYEFTNFHTLKVGSKVNLEFDILGKYVARHVKFSPLQ